MAVPYSLDPEPIKPKLPGTVVVRPTARQDVIDTLAADIAAHSIECVRRFGDFHLALSGGSTPMPLYQHLMIDPDCRAIPWSRVHLWIVDERRVPFDHEKSNWGQIDEILVQHSGIPPEQAHPMMALQEDADVAYEKLLHETLEWREKGHDRLDFVLLGMGDDGHTASLFPNSPALADNGRWVLINSGSKVTPPDRVTMTYTLLNAARYVAVLCVGEKKKSMIAKVASGEHSADELPILGVKPVRGDIRWYLDAAACP